MRWNEISAQESELSHGSILLNLVYFSESAIEDFLSHSFKLLLVMEYPITRNVQTDSLILLK